MPRLGAEAWEVTQWQAVHASVPIYAGMRVSLSVIMSAQQQQHIIHWHDSDPGIHCCAR